MNEWFLFLITSLAVWRLSHMLSKEDGPWEIFFRLRVWAGAQWDVGTAEWDSDKLFGQILTCPLCSSVWLSALTLLVLGWVKALPEFGDVQYVLWWLALSGASSILELVTDR